MQLHHQILGHGLTFWMTVSPLPKKILPFFKFFLSKILPQANCKQFETSHPPVPSVVCDHRNCNDCWKDYPQSLFPNWTSTQVKKSNLGIAIENYPRDVPCIIHYVNVDDNGYFINAGKYVATESNIKESWDRIVESRVSAIITLEPLLVSTLLFHS